MNRNFNLIIAIPLMLIAGMTVAVQGSVVKLLGKNVSISVLLLARGVVSLLLVYAYAAWKSPRGMFSRLYRVEKLTPSIVRSIAGTLALGLFYYAVRSMSIANLSAVFFCYPIVTPLVARIWLKTPIIHALWWGIGVAFVGVLFIIQPTPELFQWMALIGFLGGVCAAIGTLALRVAHQTETSERIIAWFFTVMTVAAALCMVLIPGEFEVVWSLENGAYIFISALVGIIFQGTQTVAVKYAPARLITPFLYSSVIFSAIPDFFIWGDVPSFLSVIGIVLIVIGTVLVAYLFPKQN